MSTCEPEEFSEHVGELARDPKWGGDEIGGLETSFWAPLIASSSVFFTVGSEKYNICKFTDVPIFI